jgi:hypothetical protein
VKLSPGPVISCQPCTDKANLQVAAANSSQDSAEAKPNVMQEIRAAPVARQAAPRQVASATNELQPAMADDDVIDTGRT